MAQYRCALLTILAASFSFADAFSPTACRGKKSYGSLRMVATTPADLGIDVKQGKITEGDSGAMMDLNGIVFSVSANWIWDYGITS